MATSVQWATATSAPQQSDGISPRTITPKSSFNNDNSQASSARDSAPQHSPIRIANFINDIGRQSSPLRAEFKPDAPTNTDGDSNQHAPSAGVRFEQTEPDKTSSATDGFRLQEPPKGKRKASDYFSRHTPVLRTTDSPRDSEQPSSLPRQQSATGPQTPRRRRSVQFLRSTDTDGTTEGRAGDYEIEDPEDAKTRQGSLFARLKSLATPSATHARQQSNGPNVATPYMTPAEEPEELYYPSQYDGSEAEGDAEESEGDGTPSAATRQKRKRRLWPEASNGATAPTTPRTPRFPSFLRESSTTPDGSETRPNFLARRATMGDIPENSRAGVSEDEGRDRLARKRWRKGIEGVRGQTYSNAPRQNNDTETPDSRRPMGFRRFTGFEGPSSPFRARADRHNSNSAQRWRQVKAGLKLLGQRKKDERVKVDYQKSAELMAELLAGAPAALVFASMFQRDEHHRRKVPALLEQLKVTIPGSQTKEDNGGDRHVIFTINLEYGNGASRMAWTINRSLRDFYNLHLKYKLQSQTDRLQLKGDDRHRAKLPRFPRTAVPYLRGLRGLGDDDFDDEDPINDAAGDTEASGTDRPTNKKRRQSSLARKASFQRRRHSSGAPQDPVTGAIAQAGAEAGAVGLNAQNMRGLYPDRQRKKLEVYLQTMIRWLIFRPDSTRLCKFLELSALAMRLSVEGGYHGKEGLLTIASKRSVDRHGLAAVRAIPDHLYTAWGNTKPKWFLIRHSYVVAVDSPESLVPTEVFLVDSDFAMDKRKKRLRDQNAKEIAKTAKSSASPTHLILKLYNSERKLRLIARNERQMIQFRESLEYMQKNTIWSLKHRFDSYAPVRKNVFARWLVDGRDHMWQVSRAIKHARSFIYIHDWWLSPELYMRRPAAISQDWRLDRLLKEKAEEGVKIFVIVYRNIESAIPIDSDHTKAHLLDLHPNICVQRSPNQFRQNQFFWAHHEKLVVVDNAMAFVGGVDLCFGRWDDPSHSLTDDKLTGFEVDGWNGPRNSDTCQMWPGKDYSNPRVQDFYALDRPYEEMYDRTKVPRMPWHDIAMCIVGQPARDVARHFIQRWNYILRQRTPSRPTPVLLPPPEFEHEELERFGMNGTCQIQILRSCSPWSIGTPNKTEHSIMNAYEHLIKESEHFVYIENQFFISSCDVEGTTIHNKIGDALVDRIERAHQYRHKWRACIVIPLMPGFQNSVDSQDGTSVRLIMQCQYRSICRGEKSIFGRLQAKGIDPHEYIEFYALRQWGKIGPMQSLTTEQLYIHAKCMIVDDRACIIGSANINERSMLGSRDSEVAAVVTDQQTIPSYMGGQPYEVGEFPHTLRMRLMREHLGIDIDEYYNGEEPSPEDEAPLKKAMDDLVQREDFATSVDPAPALTAQNLAAGHTLQGEPEAAQDPTREWIDRIGTEATTRTSIDAAEKAKTYGEKLDAELAGFGTDNAQLLSDAGVAHGRETYINTQGQEVLVSPTESREPHKRASVRRSAAQSTADTKTTPTPPWDFPRMSTRDMGLTQVSQLPPLPVVDDTDIGGPPVMNRTFSEVSAALLNPFLQAMRRPVVEDDCMRDPLADSFYKEIWHKVAENNTKLYRQVFRCMPDSEVQTWKEYRDFNNYSEKFMQSQGLGQSKPKTPKDAPDASGPPGSAGAQSVATTAPTEVAAKTGGRLSGFANKFLRPTSNASQMSKQPDMAEKSHTDLGQTISGHADGEFDEKTAERQASADVRNPASPNPEQSTTEPADPEKQIGSQDPEKTTSNARRSRTITFSNVTSNDPNHAPETTATQSNPADPNNLQRNNSQKRRRRATTKSSIRPNAAPETVLEKEEAEELLKLTQGTLVLWPYDWLAKEEQSGNWLYNIDQIAPLEIYD
ncbi:hypothetical protein MBLNU457_4060t1 [Dothideomycetes sp. NU457]